jgi:hypothetical protein
LTIYGTNTAFDWSRNGQIRLVPRSSFRYLSGEDRRQKDQAK